MVAVGDPDRRASRGREGTAPQGSDLEKRVGQWWAMPPWGCVWARAAMGCGWAEKAVGGKNTGLELTDRPEVDFHGQTSPLSYSFFISEWEVWTSSMSPTLRVSSQY